MSVGERVTQAGLFRKNHLVTLNCDQLMQIIEQNEEKAREEAILREERRREEALVEIRGLGSGAMYGAQDDDKN